MLLLFSLLLSLFMVSVDEWKELSKHFQVDHEIRVNRSIEESSHSVCQPCMTKRMDEEKKVFLKFSTNISKMSGIILHFPGGSFSSVTEHDISHCSSQQAVLLRYQSIHFSLSCRNCFATATSQCSSGG